MAKEVMIEAEEFFGKEGHESNFGTGVLATSILMLVRRIKRYSGVRGVYVRVDPGSNYSDNLYIRVAKKVDIGFAVDLGILRPDECSKHTDLHGDLIRLWWD